MNDNKMPKTPLFQKRKLPLRLILIAPFLLQIFLVVGLVGWISFRNSQRAINDLATQLLDKVSKNVEKDIERYIDRPPLIVNLNVADARQNLLDPENLVEIQNHFREQMQIFPLVREVFLGDREGRFLGVLRRDVAGNLELKISENFPERNFYQLNTVGERKKLLKTDESYDATIRPWYKVAVANNALTWSDIYTFVDSGTLGITASSPFFDRNGDLAGVMAASLNLGRISEFLSQTEVSPSGQIFIMDRLGLLIGTSTDQPTFVVDTQKETQRLSATESEDPLTQAGGTFLLEKIRDLTILTDNRQYQFTYNGQKQFLNVLPYQNKFGLDWLIVIVVPESDFMAQIHANTRATIGFCVLALGVATMLGIYTTRWIVQPILQVVQSSRRMAQGNLNQQVSGGAIAELNILTDAFNQMSAQLKTAFTGLEQRVQERTAQLAEAKETADKANQAKSDFLANMSHELRTPLNGVLGYAQILSHAPELSDKSRHGVKIIHQSGSHLLTLINDVLDLAKIEARKLELNPTPIHLPSLLQSVVEMCDLRAQQQQIEFIYQPSDRLPEGVHVDEKRLRQVLINLLGNAIKFTTQGKVTLTVAVLDSTHEETTRLNFKITDTGVGIAPDDLSKLFEAFEQVGDRDKQAEGTGLGLAISQQIVNLMGSQIQVASELGKGSQFSFVVEIPLVQDWMQQKTLAETKQIIGYQGDRRRILIIDDRLENRAVIMGLLEPLGFEVLEADNGQIGLEQMRQTPVDLIILDIAMPVMNGFEFLKNLRQDSQLKETKVIFSSASVAQADREMAHQAGGDDFLAKPVQMPALVEVLTTHLSLNWLYRESEQTALPETSEPSQGKIPPREQLQELLTNAQQGDARRVRLALENLVNADESYHSFANPLLSLTKQFKIEEVEEQLHQYLQEETVSSE